MLLAGSGCSAPVTRADDLNGCYFAGGSDWVFKISDETVSDRHGRFLSTISLARPSYGDSVVLLTPGLALSETPQKSMVVVQGETRKLLAAKWHSDVYLVFVDVVGRIDFQRQQCAE